MTRIIVDALLGFLVGAAAVTFGYLVTQLGR